MKYKMKLFSIVLGIAASLLFFQSLYPQTCFAYGIELELTGFQVDSQQAGSQLLTTVTIDESALSDSLRGNPTAAKIVIPVTVRAGIVKLRLTGQVLKILDGRIRFIELKENSAAYVLPVSEVSPARLAGKIGSGLADLTVHIIIDGTGGKQAPAMAKMIASNGFEEVASPTEFRVEVSTGAKTVELNGFENYVERTVTLSKEVDINQAVAIGLTNNGTLTPVPTQFTVQNGKTAAVIKHKSNGVYAVIAHPQHFTDTEGHWGSGIIDILASKLIVSGSSAAAFQPNGKINRAEFAVIISRALGLDPGQTNVYFRDVRKNDWFSGAVGAACNAGLISGYGNGNFRPYENVTREQAAVILTKVFQTVDKGRGVGEDETETSLARFTDSETISSWARPFVAFASKYAIIAGDSSGVFNPQKAATRAEAAVMIKQIMAKAGLLSPNFDLALPGDKSITNQKALTITGIVEKGSIITVNGTEKPVSDNSKFNFMVELKPGINLITVKITDPWGNVSVFNSNVTYQLNLVGSVTYPSDGLVTNRSPITVTGTAKPGSAVIVNNVKTTADINGKFNRPVNLNIGKNLISVTSIDQTGTETTNQRTVIFDNVPPVLIVLSPAEKLETADNLLVITGYTEPGSTVYVNGTTTQIDSSGNFSQAVDLTVYSSNITVAAFDIAGNKNSVDLPVRFKSNRIENFKLPAQIRIGARNSLQYTLGLDGYVNLRIYDSQGNCIRPLLTDSFNLAGNHSKSWDGKNDSGELVSDGRYRFVVEEKDAEGLPLGRAELTQLAAEFPSISQFRTTPGSFNPGTGGNAAITFDIPCSAMVTAEVYRGNTLIKVIAANLWEPAGTVSLYWDGRDNNGSLAGDGRYSFQVKAFNPVDDAFASTAKGYITIEKEAPVIKDFVTKGTYRIIISAVDLSGKPSQQASASFTMETSPPTRTPARPFFVTRQSFRLFTETPVRPVTPKITDLANTADPFDPSADTKIGSTAKGTVTVEKGVPSITGVSLGQNNLKFGTSIIIRYTLSENCSVNLKIVDANGKLVRNLLADTPKKAGLNSTSWDGTDNSGQYGAEGSYKFIINAVDSFGNSAQEQVITFRAGYLPTFQDVTVTPAPYNPNDRNGGLMRIEYTVAHDALVTAEVMNGYSSVKKLLNAQRVNQGKNRLEWNGEDSKNSVVGDGTYYIKLTAASPTISVFQSVYKAVVTVEKENPRITQVTVSPNPFKLNSSKQLTLRYSLSENAKVSIGIYQGDTILKSLIPETVKRAGNGSASWDGRDSENRVVQRGVYIIRIKAVDAFGKTGEVSQSVEFIPYFSVNAVNPADGAKDVAINSKIQVTFTESVKKDVDFKHILVQVQGRNIQYRGTQAGSTITLTPSVKLAYGTTYNVNIPSDAVEDKQGRHLPESYAFSFTTEGAMRPDSGLVDLSGFITSSVVLTENKINTVITIDEDKALAALAGSKTVRTVLIPVTVNSDVISAELTAGLIRELIAKNAVIQVHSIKASLAIPASAFKLDELAAKFGADASEVCIKIILSMPEPGQAANFQNRAKKQKLTTITGPVQFRIEAAVRGKVSEIAPLGRYASFILYLPKGINADAICGVNVTGSPTLTPMPTTGINEYGLAGAGVRSRYAGTFAVVKNSVSFQDLRSHWASQDINLLAARMIVSGVNQKSFAPDRYITRAQFVTMVAKAIGLQPRPQAVVFTDVSANAWYSGYVAAGVEAGIVSGFADKAFKPELSITREEAAVVILRAMEWVCTQNSAAPDGSTAELGRFKDKDKISMWAKEYVAKAVGNGLLQGYTGGTFAPGKMISRAECAVVVRKLLSKTGLI